MAAIQNNNTSEAFNTSLTWLKAPITSIHYVKNKLVVSAACHFYVSELNQSPRLTQDDKTQSHTRHVTALAISACGKRIVSAGEEKTVKLWVEPDTSSSEFWKAINSVEVKKKITTLAFSPVGNEFIMADKFGEVFITTFISSEQGTLSRILLLGHCSLVTDMILSPDGAYIATCDRDEKIRVSQFPKSYEIESFCMGHSQFTTRLVFCRAPVMVSGAGDGTLKSWNIHSGKCLDTYVCNKEGQLSPCVVIPQCWTDIGFLVAIVEGENNLRLFDVSQSGAFSLREDIALPSRPIWAAFDPTGELLCVSVTPAADSSSLLAVFKFNKQSTKWTPHATSSTTLLTTHASEQVSETQLTEILEKLQWSVLRKVGVPPKRKREGRSPSEKPQKRPKLESS